MDIVTSIEETEKAMRMFYSNRFMEAKEYLKAIRNRAVYPAFGYGMIVYMQAALTFTTDEMKVAMKALRECSQVCQRFRKQHTVTATIGHIVIPPNYNKYTEEECHAELIYAECLLLRAVLTFTQDENFASFIRGGWKVRCSYQCYKECLRILNTRRWKTDALKDQFQGGVKLGIGMFNLFISMLPTRILKLLEFVGFSGDKLYGLESLEQSRVTTSIRMELAACVILAYHNFLVILLENKEGDLEYSNDVVNTCLDQHPGGVLFLFYAGRIEEIRGNIEASIALFEDCINKQNDWRQFHHACYWELMWNHILSLNWGKALIYADLLRRQSVWSKASYTFFNAVILEMCNKGDDNEIAIANFYDDVPKLKQRIAGKSLPLEKYAINKCTKFAKLGPSPLPGLELIYLWNGFRIISKKPELFNPVIELVDETLAKIDDSNYWCADNKALIYLLKGMCLRHNKDCLPQAEEYFEKIIGLEKSIRFDRFLLPNTLVEMSLICIETNRFSEAKKMLNKAKSKYEHFALESRLHFRVHAALTEIVKLSQEMGKGAASNQGGPAERTSGHSRRPSGDESAGPVNWIKQLLK